MDTLPSDEVSCPAHFMIVNDVGHVANRGDRFDYFSKVFDAQRAAEFKSIAWEGNTPFATRIEFQVRSGPSVETLKKTPWTGPEGPDSYYWQPRSQLREMAKDARYFQFKASLISPNGANTPVLRSTTVEYR